jgi:Tol biopolymer transport system component
MVVQISEEREINSSWKLHHPLLYCGGLWLLGLLNSAFGIEIISLLSSISLVFRTYALFPIVIGLSLGLVSAFRRKRRLQKNPEYYARRIAYKLSSREQWREIWPWILLEIFFLIFGSVLSEFLTRITEGSFFIFPLFIGAFFLPFLLFYPEQSKIYQRTKQIVRGENADPYTSRIEESGSPWSVIVGIASILLVLAWGIWQTAISWQAIREPKQYATRLEPGGRSTQLTYGLSAEHPAVSPDGRWVAFTRNELFFNHLEIMASNGTGKRRIISRPEISPASPSALAWSPDGKRILLVGEQAPETNFWQKPPEPTLVYDIWTVDFSGGEAHRLTKNARAEYALWTSPITIAAAAKTTGHRQIWLMGADGGQARVVPELILTENPQDVRLWSNDRLLVVGYQRTPGLWSVDITTGRATRILTGKIISAFPLNDGQVIFAQSSKVGDHRVSSIGLLDPATGKTKWLRQNLRGWVHFFGLSQKPAAIFFTKSKAKGRDLWVLNLTDGRLRQITEGRYIWQAILAPDAKSVFYTEMTLTDEKRYALPSDIIWRLDLKPDLWEKAQK